VDEQQRYAAGSASPYRQVMPWADLDHRRRDDFSRKSHAVGLHRIPDGGLPECRRTPGAAAVEQIQHRYAGRIRR
jgi:hypothetical protein